MAVQKRKRYAEVYTKECVACGSCIKVCPKEAIKVMKGIYAEVDRDLCVGCGLCQKACPASVIQIIAESVTVQLPEINEQEVSSYE
ncbi:MAG TPA: 4Fe-4S dicluster-binding protein [Lachnospiraceae bacterium]|nr:4Fe-4S dicluster-binding protein [Lachnospiraceae bacterium]